MAAEAMGEQACIVQDNGYTKVDPIAALRESVSFGRFVSESLDWGKWSSFSQNRHLEEAEKYSTRGSVAQKKALFEAHYKKIAAKKAAALLEQENGMASIGSVAETDNGGFGSGDTDSEFTESNAPTRYINDGNCNEVVHEPEMKPKFAEALTDVAVHEVEVNETTTLTCSIANQDDTHSTEERIDLEMEAAEEAKHATEEGSCFEAPPQIELAEVLEDIENQNKVIEVNHITLNQLQKSPLKESSAFNQEMSASSDMKRKFSIFKPSFFKRSHKAFPSPTKSMTPTVPSKENSSSPSGKKSMKHQNDSRKSTPKALHMSTNLSPYQKGEITRPVNKGSPTIEKVRDTKVTFGCCKAFPDFSNPHRTPTREYAKSKLATTTPQSEKRSKTPSEKTDLGSRKTDVNKQAMTVDNGKPLSTSGRKTSTSHFVSPFCFRSDERAEKRKEYFLKLEEKLNAEKLERQAKAKEKAENELKLLRQSLGFKARPMPDFYRKNEPSKIEDRKRPSIQPQPPKVGRNRSTLEVPVTNSQPSFKSSIKSDKYKLATVINN